MPIREFFRKFSHQTADVVGSPGSFISAVTVILLWIISGLLFHFSDTWQLVINTATTIVTFLMVFLIQNSQNRDSRAIHLKLNEIIHGVHGARNDLIELEELSDEELDKLHREFQQFHKMSHEKLTTIQRIKDLKTSRKET
jgi:low affinity Fe/Cu permease